jgi:hypothetical protein
MKKKLNPRINRELMELEAALTKELKSLFEKGAFSAMRTKIAEFLEKHEEFGYNIDFGSNLWGPTPRGYKNLRVRSLGDIPNMVQYEFQKHPKYEELYRSAKTLKLQGLFLEKVRSDSSVARQIFSGMRPNEGTGDSPCPRCHGSGIAKSRNKNKNLKRKA